MLSPITVKKYDITGCNEQTVYKLIQSGRRIGLILKVKNKFVITEIIGQN